MPSCPSTPREPPNLHNFQRGLRFGSDFCLSIFAGSKKNAPIFVILRVDFSRDNHKGCLLCFGSETSKEWLKESWDLRHRRIWETNWTRLSTSWQSGYIQDAPPANSKVIWGGWEKHQLHSRTNWKLMLQREEPPFPVHFVVPKCSGHFKYTVR